MFIGEVIYREGIWKEVSEWKDTRLLSGNLVLVLAFVRGPCLEYSVRESVMRRAGRQKYGFEVVKESVTRLPCRK